MSCVGIVLAGGASSRFGSDKLAAPIDRRPLLHHALLAVAAVADRIVLVLAPDAAAPVLPEDLVPRIVIARDAAPHGGPLAGIAAGLAALAAEEAGGIAVVVGGDMPSLQPAVLRLLVDALERRPGVVAMSLEASPPSPLPLAVRPEVAGTAIGGLLAADRRSLRGLLGAVPSATVPEASWHALDPAALTLRDVDTPGDI